MSQYVPKGFDINQQEMQQQLMYDMNKTAKKLPEKFGGLTGNQKAFVYITIFLTGACKLYSSVRELEFSGALCGMRLVKHFCFHGVKLSTDVFVEVFEKFSSIEAMSKLLTSTVEGNIHTIGSSFTAGLVHILVGILETLWQIRKYIWNSWWKYNNNYPMDALCKDLKNIWKANLLAAGVTSLAAGSFATALVACGITVAWPYIVGGVVAGLLGTFAKWKYNTSSVKTKYSKLGRDKRYKQYAKAENSKHKYKKNEKWPEELSELVWIFESMDCLLFGSEGTLNEEKVNHLYKLKSKDSQLLNGFEKLDKEGLWVFRRTILLRYVQQIQGSKTEVEEVIVEALKIRLKEVTGDNCSIM